MAELITLLSEYRTRFDTCFATDFIDVNIKVEALKHLCNGYAEILKQYLQKANETSELFVPSISMKFISIGNEMHERLDSLIEKIKSGAVKAPYKAVKGARHPDADTFRMMFALLPAVPPLKVAKEKKPVVRQGDPGFDGPDADEEPARNSRTIGIPTFKGGLHERKNSRKAQHQKEKQLRKEVKRARCLAEAEMNEALNELKATLEMNASDVEEITEEE